MILSIIELFVMKLYVSFGALLLNVVGVAWNNQVSGIESMMIATPFFFLVYSCNFFVLFFLVMDEQFNKAERIRMEIIITMFVVIRQMFPWS